LAGVHTLEKCWPQVYKLVQIFAMGFLVLLRLGSLWGQDHTEKDSVGKVLRSRLPCEKARWSKSLTTVGLLPGMESSQVFW
jgi:hypothetical protein